MTEVKVSYLDLDESMNEGSSGEHDELDDSIAESVVPLEEETIITVGLIGLIKDRMRQVKNNWQVKRDFRRLQESAQVMSEILDKSSDDLSHRFAMAASIGQTISSVAKLGQFGGMFHAMGACLCHGGGITSAGKMFSMPGVKGGHFHLGAHGEKIYHDDQHRHIKPEHQAAKTHASLSRVNSSSSVRGRSGTTQNSQSSFIPTFRLIPEGIRGVNQVLRSLVGPEDSVSPMYLLPLASRS